MLCRICGKEFSSMKAVIGHMNKHRDLKKKRLAESSAPDPELQQAMNMIVKSLKEKSITISEDGLRRVFSEELAKYMDKYLMNAGEIYFVKLVARALVAWHEEEERRKQEQAQG